MRHLLGICALTLLVYVPSSSVLAVGTVAGTDISSQAVVSYTIGADNHTSYSNEAVVIVNEVLDFVVEWQDATSVGVFPGDQSIALTFLLQNTGNGFETFLFTGLDALAGDDFDPALGAIYLDNDDDGLFDPTLDQPYTEGVNDPELAPDQSTAVFLVSNIPLDLIDGALGNCKLAVGSVTGYGATGTIIFGAGDEGTDVIIGSAGGFAECVGTYVVATALLTLSSSATILDPRGGSAPVSDAVITYTISVLVSGSGTTSDVVVTDPLPAYTEYLPGSLTLNGVALTDAVDADLGDVGGTTAATVTVALGDLTATMQQQEISFQVIIR